MINQNDLEKEGKIVCVINYLEVKSFKIVQAKFCLIWYYKIDFLNHLIFKQRETNTKFF